MEGGRRRGGQEEQEEQEEQEQEEQEQEKGKVQAWLGMEGQGNRCWMRRVSSIGYRAASPTTGRERNYWYSKLNEAKSNWSEKETSKLVNKPNNLFTYKQILTRLRK